MFGKSDQTRINDTLTMIENAPDLTLLIRQQIRAFVTNLYPRLTAAERQAYHQLSAGMSVAANIGPGVARGNAAEREKRRAIFLLWTAIGKQQMVAGFVAPRAAQAMTMATGALNAAFSDVMLKAAVVAPGAGGQQVFQDFTANPVPFLTQHRIIVRGSGAGADRFSTAPTGNYQNVMNFYFQYDAGNDRFVLISAIAAGLGANLLVPTVSVPAVHWSQVPGVGAQPGNFAGVLGCELAGANFMLTTQFTGCAFCWTSHAGVLRASHLSPAGGGPVNYVGGGIALAQRLVGHGAMANAGGTALTVFGAGAGNAVVPGGGNAFYPNPATTALSWVSIIGVMTAGAWRLYTQVINLAGLIVEARRIL